MRLTLGTTLAGGGGLPTTAFQLGLTGLTDGAARPGAHATLGYTIVPDQGTETVLWGSAPGDDTYGTAAQPTDYSAADGDALWLTCTDDGQTVYVSIPIRHPSGAAPSVADGQTWIVDDTAVTLDASASGADLTWSYVASGLPQGVVIDATTGAISGTPLGADAGTALITATDQYGRSVQDSFTWEAALRPAAVASNSLGPFSFTVADDVMSIDFVLDFTSYGNTLSYEIDGLPSGGVDNGDGTASGVATTAGQSGPIVCTATDEYGRETTSTASCTTSFRAPAFADGALSDRDWIVDDDIVSLDLTGDFTTGGNTLSYVISGLPAGLSDDGDGSLSGTPTTDGQAGTITVVATDEYGRQTASAFSYTTAYRAVASGGTDLDLSFPQNVGIAATDLVQGWTRNGNTLSVVSVAPSLPSGLSLTGAGVLSGVPTVIDADDTYTLTMGDEYGRQTQDTFTLEITAAGGGGDITAPTVSSLSAGPQGSDGHVPVTVDGLDENSTVYWVLVQGGDSAPSAVQIIAGQTSAGNAAADSGSFTATTTGGPYTEALATGLGAMFDLYAVFRDASGNASAVYSDAGIAIDTTPPVLSLVTITSTGATTAEWKAVTSEAGGTVHVRVRAPGDPTWTAQDIIAGADDTYSPAEAIDETGLSLTPDYWIDAATGNDTNSGSQGSPWASLSKIGDLVLGADETVTVRVKTGVYDTTEDYVWRNDISGGGAPGAGARLNLVFEAGTIMDGAAANSVAPTDGFEFSGANSWTTYVYGNGLAVRNYAEATSASPNGFGNRGQHTLHVYDADVDNCDDGFSSHDTASMYLYRCAAQGCEKSAIAHIDTTTTYHYDCAFTEKAGGGLAALVVNAPGASAYFERCSFTPDTNGANIELFNCALVECAVGTPALAFERTGASNGSTLTISDSFINFATDASLFDLTLRRCFGRFSLRQRNGGLGVLIENCVISGPATSETRIFYSSFNPGGGTRHTVRNNIFETASASDFMSYDANNSGYVVAAGSIWEHNVLSGSAAFDADLIAADTGATVIADNETADALIGSANTLDPDDYGYGTGSPAIGAASDGGNSGFAIGELSEVGTA